jgi:hypothetical protein
LKPNIEADYAVSINNSDNEIGPSTVTLSRSEGSVAMGVEMLRCAQHLAAQRDRPIASKKHNQLQ